jgi:hypothetical protein
MLLCPIHMNLFPSFGLPPSECWLDRIGCGRGAWLLMFLLVTLASPILIVMSQHRLGVIARLRKHARIVSDSRDQSSLDPDRIDVYRWESEGGAPRMCVSSPFVDPAKATPSPQSVVLTAAEV